MTPGELAATLLQQCADEANALLLLTSFDKEHADALMTEHRALVEAAMYAGIAGAIHALERLGMLVEPDPV